MLGLPSAVTVIKDLDDAAAVAAAGRTRLSIPTPPVITHTAATPQDSPKDADQRNNIERSTSLQLPYGLEVIFTARRLAKRGICRRRVSVCVCVCHTPVLYQNG